ncbi:MULTISPECIES: sensor histidine kinase [unclassified Nostoc]|uniref:sensor histidine kinase n=1 Tax=unclassified Nostoc TaxID=2593658 RepID=UPI0018EF70E4|nr:MULTISPECIES: ATP-binding protein [unclassified Nostoc]
MNIYTHSVEVNHQWAKRLQSYAEINEFLTEINAPGNNIFDSRDIAGERKKLKAAQDSFQKFVRLIRDELTTQVVPTQSQLLLENLDAAEAATTKMVTESQLIFFYFSQQQPEIAGRHMAKMDQEYHQANQILVQFRRNISQIQQQLLEQQQEYAKTFLLYEIAIATAIFIMVICVTLYGHQLANKMRLDAQCKEKSIRDSQTAQSLLEEQKRQLKLTLENLQKTQSQLVQSEKMSSLGQLVSGIAHEVNNPVNFIHANLSYLQEYSLSLLTLIQLYQKYYPSPVAEIQNHENKIDLEFLQNDLLKIVDSMSIGTQRISKIVQSLRNFSRMDEAECKPVDIHEGIDSTLLILQHRLKATNTRPEILVNRDYSHLPTIECYAGQMNQVFINILANAIYALEEANQNRTYQEIQAHPHSITISTSLINSEWVEIAIADNGNGIPEAIQPRIFDPFFTTKPVGKGTGMGMSISYQIITEQHGGKLEFSSVANQGTKFVIQIPIQQKVPQTV